MANATNSQEDVLANVSGQLDEIDATLHNVWYFARVWADVAGGNAGRTVEVDSEAMAHAMAFFADEVTAARASTAAAHGLLGALRAR